MTLYNQQAKGGIFRNGVTLTVLFNDIIQHLYIDMFVTKKEVLSIIFEKNNNIQYSHSTVSLADLDWLDLSKLKLTFGLTNDDRPKFLTEYDPMFCDVFYHQHSSNFSV